VLLMLAVAIAGTALGPTVPTLAAVARPRWSVYGPLLIVNAALALYVGGASLERHRFRAMFWQGRYDARRFLTDLAWAALLTLLLLTAENGFQIVGAPESTAAHALLPATINEKLAWLGVAALVGFSEELVYRGYLQRQLGALSGRLSVGIVAQALLFGIAHGEQGPWAVARFALYAVALGGTALARKSLLPGMACHVAIDWYAAWSV